MLGCVAPPLELNLSLGLSGLFCALAALASAARSIRRLLLALLLPLHEVGVGWAYGEGKLGQLVRLRRHGDVGVVRAFPVALAGFPVGAVASHWAQPGLLPRLVWFHDAGSCSWSRQLVV